MQTNASNAYPSSVSPFNKCTRRKRKGGRRRSMHYTRITCQSVIDLTAMVTEYSFFFFFSLQSGNEERNNRRLDPMIDSILTRFSLAALFNS